MRAREPARRPHDGSRTRGEVRVAFPSVEKEDEIPPPTWTFSLREITSRLPEDSREEEERAAGRRLRDLRGRVTVARAVVALTSGLAETLEKDWPEAARFCARFGVTEGTVRHGARALDEGFPSCRDSSAVLEDCYGAVGPQKDKWYRASVTPAGTKDPAETPPRR